MSDEERTESDDERSGFIDWYQAGVLSDRYMEMVLGDLKNTGLLLLQAPLLAFMAVLVWDNVERGSPTLYFVMVLSMFWIGCMNACREIVKERCLFLRERMFDLDVGAYLYSKVRVLALIGVIQVVIYAVIVAGAIDVRVPIAWLILNLMATVLCGTCLGLLISASVKRSDYAVAWVPLVIIPQLVFSEFTIPEDRFEGLSEVLYLAMPTRWSYESLMYFGETATDHLAGAGYIIPLFGYCLLFLLVAYPILRFQKY